MHESAILEAVVSGHQEAVMGTPKRRARAPRRKMPLGRGAVLVVDGRTHIVGVADVSLTGAFLTTRAPVAPGKVCELRLAPVAGRVQLGLCARVVRLAQGGEEASHHPRGVAVEFVGLAPEVQELLAGYVGQGPDLVP